jgi:integrase
VLREEADYASRVYAIVWSENGRTKRKSTGETDPRRAEAFFAAWLAERRRATPTRGPSDPADVKVVDVLADYAAEHGKDTASPDTVAYSVEPLMAFFANDTIADLTSKRVKQYWTWRRDHSVTTLPDGTARVVTRGDKDTSGREIKRVGAKNGTIIRELGGALRPAIKHAIEEKRLKLAMYHIPVPKAPPGRDYWITRQEAARLLRESRRDPRARLHLPLYTLIALYTGQRRGAILELTWTQVDLVHGIVDFNPPGRLQTKKTRPKIPVPRSLLVALRRAHKRASCAHVIAYHGQRVLGVKTAFNSAAARAGIPDCTSHTLRHTAGTWMAARGVSMREIGGYLGHSEQRTTELYAHHHPDFLKNARQAFEGSAPVMRR